MNKRRCEAAFAFIKLVWEFGGTSPAPDTCAAQVSVPQGLFEAIRQKVEKGL
jgi:hypothetical protein